MQNLMDWGRVGSLALLLFGSSQARADLLPEEFKGIHALVKPEYEHLSPIHALSLLSSGELENRRFFGNYGPEKAPHDCMKYVGPRTAELFFAEPADCPQDYNSELIQRLFPSDDRTSFIVNQYPKDFVSKLPSEVIGKIINWTSTVMDHDLNDPKILKKLITDLIVVIMDSHKAFDKEANQALTTLNKKLKPMLASSKCDPNERDDLQSEASLLAAKLVEIRGIVETSPEKNLVSAAKYGEAKEFATTIINSLVEARKPESKYPRHLPEQVLEAFALKRGHGKEEILRLFTHLSNVRTDQATSILNNINERTNFLNSTYTKHDLSDSRTREPEKIAAIQSNKTRHDKQFIKMLNYGKSYPDSWRGRPTKMFSDCGETFLRNIFNLILYNSETQRFEPERLDLIPGGQISPKLREFYERNRDATLIGLQTVRNDWAEHVASGLPGVEYRNQEPGEKGFDIAGTGISNMISAIEALVYKDYPPGHSPLTRATVDSNVSFTTSEKMDKLMKVLFSAFKPSVPKSPYIGFRWNDHGRRMFYPKPITAETGIKIDLRLGHWDSDLFGDGDIPSITMCFQDGHFFVYNNNEPLDALVPENIHITKEMLRANFYKMQLNNDEVAQNIIMTIANENMTDLYPQLFNLINKIEDHEIEKLANAFRGLIILSEKQKQELADQTLLRFKNNQSKESAALLAAAQTGDPAIFRKLLDLGYKIKKADVWWQILRNAGFNGNKSVTDWFYLNWPKFTDDYLKQNLKAYSRDERIKQNLLKVIKEN